MSEFFPKHQIIKVNSDVELLAFQCQSTVVQLAAIAPKACFQLHHHSESQMGMIFTGSLEINVNGNKQILSPLQQVYVAGANVPHGSVNHSTETVLGFDVKRIVNSLPSAKDEEVILELSPTKDETTNLPCQSGVGSWFETVICKIPPGGKIPIHQSAKEEMGIPLNGKIAITVGSEQQELEYGQIYYAPANVVRGGYNTSEEEVTLIKILIAPDSGSNL